MTCTQSFSGTYWCDITGGTTSNTIVGSSGTSTVQYVASQVPDGYMLVQKPVPPAPRVDAYDGLDFLLICAGIAVVIAAISLFSHITNIFVPLVDWMFAKIGRMDEASGS